MGYSDYIQDVQRPSCWGNASSYDRYDPECCGCRFKTSCSAAVENAFGARRVPVHTTQSVHHAQAAPMHRSDEPYRGMNTPAVITEGETALARFMKDATAGALRGAFWEMYQFWKFYRIK